MTTLRPKRRLCALASISLAALTGAVLVPTSATAAEGDSTEGVSHATAQLLSIEGSLADALSVDDLASLNGSEMTHGTSLTESEWGANGAEAIVNSNAIEHVKGIDASVLDAINLGELELELQDVLNLSDIISLGAVTQYTKASRFGSSVGFAGTVSDMDGAIETSDGYRITSYDPTNPAATITLGTDALSIDAEVGAIVAIARDNQFTGNPIHTASYDIAGLELEVGGDLIGGVLNTLRPLLTTLGVDLEAAGLVDFDSGAVTVSLDDILESHNAASINDLPPNTDLLAHLPSLVVGILDETVTQLLDDSGLLGGILDPILGPIVDQVLNLLSGLSTTLLDPLTDELVNLLALNVNNVTDEDGVITVSALEVDILNGALVLPLATASAGGNAKAVLGTGEVTLSGTQRAGQYLTADAGEGWIPADWDIANPDDLQLRYQWYSDGEPIEGATHKRIRLNTAMIDTVMNVEVSASLFKVDGSQAMSGNGEAVATNRAHTSKDPVVVGTGERGSVLTADLGEIYPTNADVRVVWFRDGKYVGTGLSHTVTWFDRDSEMTFRYAIEANKYVNLKGQSSNSVTTD